MRGASTALTAAAVLGTGLACLACLGPVPRAAAAPRPDSYWQVDDLRAGMRGYGRTTMHGTKVESFEAEVLGVMKNTSPGRDMVLCRLSGLNLEKTGVIAGMSGSPIYIDNKLLGAVAYAWPFGKEPIAGVTPFAQMHAYVESYERRDLAGQGDGSGRIGAAPRGERHGVRLDAARLSGLPDVPAGGDGLWLTPLRTPVAASGFTERSLALLGERCRAEGLVPVQGGAAGARVLEQEKDAPLVPGSPLAVSMVRGDFDLSGIGTVTHVEGNRVYGWGHPFFGSGDCEFPLLTGYIHTVYPRQTVSMKLGSPLREVGVINADVSTGIAGWLGRKPDLMPLSMSICRGPGEPVKTLHVEVVRQRSLTASLVYAVLTNSVDMEGELPEELTAELRVRIQVDGRPPVVIQDSFSGFSGGRAPQALYTPVAAVLSLLSYNPYQPVRIERIDCETRITPGRRTAEVEAVELDSEAFAPGEVLKGSAFVRPYKGPVQRLPVSLKLPADLPEGRYTVTVCDGAAAARHQLHDDPSLSSPQDLDQVFAALKVQTEGKRTQLAARVPLPAVGVALAGKSLPNLPPGMVEILGHGRRTGSQTVGGAAASYQATPWVIQGSECVSFTVAKNKKLYSQPER